MMRLGFADPNRGSIGVAVQNELPTRRRNSQIACQPVGLWPSLAERRNPDGDQSGVCPSKRFKIDLERPTVQQRIRHASQ